MTRHGSLRYHKDAPSSPPNDLHHPHHPQSHHQQQQQQLASSTVSLFSSNDSNSVAPRKPSLKTRVYSYSLSLSLC